MLECFPISTRRWEGNHKVQEEGRGWEKYGGRGKAKRTHVKEEGPRKGDIKRAHMDTNVGFCNLVGFCTIHIIVHILWFNE